MQRIANSIMVPRDQTQRDKRRIEEKKNEEEEETQRSHRSLHRQGWTEGMSREDLYESLQKSFISYLRKKKCYIRKDQRGPLTFYRVEEVNLDDEKFVIFRFG